MPMEAEVALAEMAEVAAIAMAQESTMVSV